MNQIRVPFNRPTTASNSGVYVDQALKSMTLAGDGPFSRRAEIMLGERLHSRVFLAPSCTAALELCALLTRIGPGDEVIVPSFTFTSTALAFSNRGAQIVFADCRPDTLNIDASTISRLISPRTRAIVAMHYGGIACEMDEITELATQYGIPVIEDNAHGLGGHYRDRPLGSLGILATQSFHETKNFSTGEGGALVVNSDQLIERVEILREKGTNRTKFWRGEIDKYTWIDDGSSFLVSEMTAALLVAQLEQFEKVQAARKCLWQKYRIDLAEWAIEMGVHLPVVPRHCVPAYHLFYLLFPNWTERERVRERLREQGILAVTHYVPLHSSPRGRQVGRGDCPVAEDVSARLLRLPFYSDMRDDEQDYVISTLLAIEAP